MGCRRAYLVGSLLSISLHTVQRVGSLSMTEHAAPPSYALRCNSTLPVHVERSLPRKAAAVAQISCSILNTAN